MKAIRNTLIVFIIGIITLAAGTFFLIDNQGTYEKTEAVIVRIDSEYDYVDSETDYTVFVNYVIDGKEYNMVNLGSYDASMYEGKKIEIEYNVDNPGKIRTGSAVIVTIILFVVGGLCILFSLGKVILAFVLGRR